MGGDTSPEQQYALRWNDFPSSMLSSFRHLREEEDFVDVTLACDGCSFTAHKVVLSACSPYFRRLLKANPCQHPIVILRDVQEKDMENLLRFMYNGEVNIGEEHLPDFMKTAQMLQIRGLVDFETKAQKTATTEQKITPNVAPLPWTNDRPDASLDSDVRSPAAKRPRGSENREPQDVYTPERGTSPSRGNNESQESLLGQALEGGPTIHITPKGNSENSLQAQSTGEDSSDDTQMSDHDRDRKTDVSDYPPMLDDHHPFNTNGGGLIDPNRTPGFPSALLNLSGIPGLLPGPSSIHNADSFSVNRRSLEMMRVRATDPRPCPKCGKIYRSAHTLRTHLEDKHTICPGYRCVLCGTVAKSRNSLHSHMSRQHRGISTKDLPVLPMPAPFDPELASRLLAKAGLKVSAAELRARASPTGPRRSDVKLDAKSAFSGAASEAGSSICDDNDPEDLTMSHNRYGMDFTMSPPVNHSNSPLMKMGKPSSQALAAKSIDSMHHLSKEPSYPAPLGPPTGSVILDSYLQYMSENGFPMPTTQEAVAAVQAAKLAQLSAMGLDKTPQRYIDTIQQMTVVNDLMMKRNDEIKRGDGDVVMNDDHDRDKEDGDSSGGEDDDYSDDDNEQDGKVGE